MNPRTKRTMTIAVVVVLLAALVWYLYPRSFAQAMGKNFDWEEVQQIQVYLVSTDFANGETREIFLYTDDPAYEELRTLLDSQKYNPPMGEVYGQAMQLEYYAYFTFSAQKEDGWFGRTLVIPGARNIQFLPGDGRFFSPSGGLEFQQDVIDLLLAQPCTLS